MPDCYEELHACLDPNMDDGSLDADSDALSNLQEYLIGTDPCAPDSDADGCNDGREHLAMEGFDPLAWYDFFDVPVPASPDPAPNGVRNGAVGFGDVGAVLFYSGAEASGTCGDNPNGNGFDYDCDKGNDTNGDTVADIPPDGVPDGLDYDRSPGAEPNPPWEAGPPDGAIAFPDVGAVLAQTGLNCSGPP